MEDWTDIDPSFTEELVQGWKDLGFSYEQVEEWVNAKGFHLWDYGLASFIIEKDLVIDDLEDYELDSLRKEYNDNKNKNKWPNLKKRKSEESIEFEERCQKSIRLDFEPDLIQTWVDQGFAFVEIRDWMNIGLSITDANFSVWLRDEVKVDSEYLLNFGSIEQLREQYQQYLTFSQIEQLPK